MKTKKLLSLLICFVIIISCYSFSASANGMIEYDIYVNNERYSHEPILTKIGDTINISTKNVRLDGTPVDDSEISYEWSKFNLQTQTYDVIDGANASSFSEIYDGCTIYSCFIIIGNNGTSSEIYFKEDTLTLSATSNCEIIYDDEYMVYKVYPGLVDAEGTITISAESTVDNANITYQWEKTPYYEYPTIIPEFETLNNTTNSLEFKLTAGGLHYWCTVSDGETEKFLDFEIIPNETLTMNNSVNGKVPSMYAGTYIYVVKPNEKIFVDVTSTSTFGEVNYTWFKQNQEDFSFTKLDLTEGILETTKNAPIQDDPYATQPFECFIEDGNQKIRYQILFFCLDPETPFAEINKINQDTPDINFVTDNENLANTLLSGEELRNMTWGMTASIELSAELKNTVNESDQIEINSKLQDNQNIGMHLEMNLQKDIDGEAIAITELDETIELNVDVPENLINDNTNITREYQVIRMHNGEAEVLDCKFDSQTNTISFETDKFSLYTITYTDNSNNFINLLKKALLGINPEFDKNNLGEYDTNSDKVFDIRDLVTIG